MKVLLVFPNELYSFGWGNKIKVKTHMVSLFSFLKNDFDVEVLDLENEVGNPQKYSQVKPALDSVKKILSKKDFDVVAISCWASTYYLTSVLIAEECKKINPDCLVAVGGYHSSALPSDFLYENSPFDFVIVGEGEKALKEICSKRVKPKKPVFVQGKKLEEKEFHELDWKNYPYKDKKETALYLSRGCPFRCHYCMEKSKGSGWRPLSVRKSIESIRKFVDEVNPHTIKFWDPCFGFNRKWREDFLRELIKEKFDRPFWAETRIDLTTKKDIGFFSRLGFVPSFGVESLSEKMLLLMNKTLSPRHYLKKVLEISRECNKERVPHHLYLLYSFPGETTGTLKEGLGFLKKLIKEKKKSFLSFQAFTFALFPGSFVFQNLGFFEQKFGARFYHKSWWKEQKNHNVISRKIAPSHSLNLNNKNCWKEEFHRLTLLNFLKIPEDCFEKADFLTELKKNCSKDLLELMK